MSFVPPNNIVAVRRRAAFRINSFYFRYTSFWHSYTPEKGRPVAVHAKASRVLGCLNHIVNTWRTSRAQRLPAIYKKNMLWHLNYLKHSTEQAQRYKLISLAYVRAKMRRERGTWYDMMMVVGMARDKAKYVCAFVPYVFSERGICVCKCVALRDDGGGFVYDSDVMLLIFTQRRRWNDVAMSASSVCDRFGLIIK